MHNKLILSSGLGASVLIGLTSSSFFIFWSAVELNTILFIVMLWLEGEKGSELSGMKYFLIQGFSSLLMVWGVFYYMSFLMMVGGLLKLGVFPFHLWSLDLAVSSSWDCWLYLMSLQKVLPLHLVVNVSEGSSVLSGVTLLNLVVSCLGSLHKSMLKELLFYSSLFNMSLLLLLSSSHSILVFFFLIYSSLLIPCWGILKNSEVDYLQQVHLSSGGLLAFLSLSGFPPSLGFLYKYGLFSLLVSLNYGVLYCCSVMLLSLFMFYIYLSVFLQLKLIGSRTFMPSMSGKGGYLLAPQAFLMISGSLILYSF
nr:NADH dehydrogenase subunit 2 [Lepeophtheirus salmonis]